MPTTDLEALACGLALATGPSLVGLSLESLWGPYDKMTAEGQAVVNAVAMISSMVFGLRLAFILNPEAMN